MSVPTPAPELDLETWLAFVHRMEVIFGSDLTADGSHHGTGRFTNAEWWAYNQVIDAARAHLDCEAANE
jgi:hypothetical protein